VIPGKAAVPIVETGVAFETAAHLPGKRYPLLIMSHGFGGWNTQFSRLGETLASRGYVVASINHGDLPFGDVPGFLRSFGEVMVNRASDQREVTATLLERAAAGRTALGAAIDPDKVALLGYSMGGFGALASAGAPYDGNSKPFAALPLDARKHIGATHPAIARRIKAVILVAPWGGQPDSRAWDEAALAQVRQPVLMIAGDRDDIVDYPRGVKWIFDRLRASERRLLVYREARHNVLGNPVATTGRDFAVAEYLTEPVWRSERIHAINQHFITAFLDLHLKGDRSREAFLNPPIAVASEGEWPLPFGAQTNGATAGAEQPLHWRGFQRRWAVGLELHRAVPAGASNAVLRKR
jgi:predicted dienelactone hydrolase